MDYNNSKDALLNDFDGSRGNSGNNINATTQDVISFMGQMPLEEKPVNNDENNSKKIAFSQEIGVQPTVDLTKLNAKRDSLGNRQIAAYAVGHFSNDLCATAWFTYVLFFVKDVVKLDSVIAAFVMLSGQIADGLTTPIVGFLSDQTKTRIGKRTPWYIFGTILVLPTFLGIFIKPNFEKDSPGEIAYYISLPALFNVGWACVQISNMSVVNSLTFSTQRRDRLISLRNGFSYVANFTVLTIALVLFAIIKDQVLQFRVLCFIIIGIGFCSSLYYVMSINEVRLSKSAKSLQKEYLRIHEPHLSAQERKSMTSKAKSSMLSVELKVWSDWLSEGQFYLYGLVYTLVRVAVNVTMSVQPFYLIQVTGFEKSEENPTPLPIALVPLVSYIASLLFSLFVYKRMMQRLRNRFIPLLLSVIIISVASIPYLFLNKEPSVRWLVYVLSSMQGVGLAIMINTATSLISDVIGKDDQSSAFVYGAYSFFDKVSNGLIIFGITAVWIENPIALKWCIAVIPPVCSLGAFLLAYIGNKRFGQRLAKLSATKSRTQQQL